MLVLPVLDLLNGIVVRGVAGKRSEYKPLQSLLTGSVQPCEVAQAIRLSFDFNELYVADLDAIMHQRPNFEVYQQLISDGFQLLVDAGIRNVDDSLPVRETGAQPIIGLESCPNPQTLSDIVLANQGQVTFSLDLQGGQPILPADFRHWGTQPLHIVRQAIECGISRLIVLDLADVGTSSGGRTDDLCRSVIAEFPQLRLTCGGGVRSIADLRRLQQLGARQALVASALHDGKLTTAELQRLAAT